ncbi:Protein N-acetyltransferase, RimJ/RimL family [Sulfitobacter brevis]|uniref:Protein N-acetyltransferase, RimJ/RimL family n=1 Tax=Sulfitobacter brevis TaxID=74348 RepID=A0A1I1SHR4_9RHOB|nr:GNAT family N-acetyltransferase [Sulfitobacter brevis]SFD45872.1 Protein N-acetyltransferase, RimJ/RimL family [Sulfitobacter brevis]
MLVRRLSGEDAAEFQALRLEGLKHHPEAFGASYEDEVALPLSLVSQRLSAGVVIGGSCDGHALDGMIGVMMGQSEKVRHIATIWGMYVRPQARGTGLSSELLKTAIAEATPSCRTIHLSVVSTNEAARRLYQRAGFVEWAVDSEALFANGSFHDEILMRLSAE